MISHSRFFWEVRFISITTFARIYAHESPNAGSLDERESPIPHLAYGVGNLIGKKMTNLQFLQFLETVRATQGAYYKLTIIAGGARSGKTHLLKQVAVQLDLPIINLSLLLSQRLLSQNRRQRSLNAEDAAIEVIDEHITSGLCLDDTELLFDSTLRLNPRIFLQEISRNRLIVATWNGVVTGSDLRYGHAGHPDYFSQTVNGYPVVSVAAEKLQLHLTT
jgi:hypothetical protein